MRCSVARVLHSLVDACDSHQSPWVVFSVTSSPCPPSCLPPAATGWTVPAVARGSRLESRLYRPLRTGFTSFQPAR